MTLKEAIESKKRFKRSDYSLWHNCISTCRESFSLEEVLADDWELEPGPEQKIEITKQDVKRAYSELFHRGFAPLSSQYGHALNLLLKELGFI